MTHGATQVRPAAALAPGALRALQLLQWSALGALGVYLFMRSAGMNPVVMSDEWTYSRHSRLGPLGESILPSYLYLWIFRATNACGSGFLDCARALNVLFFVAAGPFIYLLARMVCGRPVAAFVTLLCLLAPVSSFTAYFMPEALYFFLFCVLAWAALALRETPALRYGLVTGALLGVMSLVKVHALFLLPAQIVFAAAIAWRMRAQENWIARSVTAACVIAATMFAIKFALGYLLAGSNALHLLGSFYGAHAGNSLGAADRLARLFGPAMTSLKGHLMALVLLFGLPIATVLTHAFSAASRREGESSLHALLLYALLMLGAALLMTIAFTATIAAPGTPEGIRLHLRYYDFVFPLLLIGAASQIGRQQRAGASWLAAALALGVGAAAVYAALFLVPAYQLSLTDGPEIAALVQATDITVLGKTFKMFPLLVSFQLALLGWSVVNRSQAARALVFLVLPLSVISSDLTVRDILGQFFRPNDYDAAGQFARARLPGQDRAALAVAGSDQAGLARAMFHADSAGAAAIALEAGAPLAANELPARRTWLLVVGAHALPPGVQVAARTPQYALIRLGTPHSASAAVDFSAPLAGGVLERTEGLADSEPWGAWSNARQVRLRFAAPLPASLNVFINARALGPNVGKDFTIRVGADSRTFRLPAAAQERFFQFATDGAAREVTIEVPQPVTARELGLGADERKLGLGLMSMEIGSGATPKH